MRAGQWKQLLTASCWFAQELHAELAWYDENATLAAERASWFMVRGFPVGPLAFSSLGRLPSGVFLSSSDRTPLLRSTAARRLQQLLLEDVCACCSHEQAINGDHTHNPIAPVRTFRVLRRRAEPLHLLLQVPAADEEPMELGDSGITPPHSAHAADPVGHVSVCGVELRICARLLERDRQPPVLVMTNTVQQNLRSIALALCGVRHFLLLCACSLPRRCGAPGFEHTMERTRGVKITQDIRMRAPAALLR